MKEAKHVALIDRLTQATREGKLEWAPVSPGEYDDFLAVLPTGQNFALRRHSGEHGGEYWDFWHLEVRDAADEVVDRIKAEPSQEEQELDCAMRELVSAVEDAVASRLDDTILALEQLTKALR